MSKRQILVMLGVILIILPFLGLPTSWKSIATVIIGALVVLISLRIRPSQRPPVDAGKMSYVEHWTDPAPAAPAGEGSLTSSEPVPMP